jgi:hypothetical protein
MRLERNGFKNYTYKVWKVKAYLDTKGIATISMGNTFY